MIMKERMNEAKEKARIFAREQITGQQMAVDVSHEVMKKDFGKEEITHHNEAQTVFEKVEEEEQSSMQSRGPAKGMQLFKKRVKKKKTKEKTKPKSQPTREDE